MFKSIFNHFNPPPKSVAEIHADMLKDAEIKLLQHHADAGYHHAMAVMLAERVEYLKSTQVFE